MAADSDQNSEPDWLRNLPLRSEEIGFAPDELIKCTACGKANAPNRNSCLYCGVAVEGVEIEQQLDIREPESWEKGFNVVVVDAAGADTDGAAARFGSLMESERAALTTILNAGKIVPLLRVDSESQALAASDTLAEFGIRTIVVPDESLEPSSPPTRLRSIDFESGELKLELFNLGETRSLNSDELALVVPGRIFQTRSESIEKRKRRGAKTLGESEISSDEPVIDIYSRSDPTGWRIPARGFDFSCLGSKKTLIAAENMTTLASKLAEFSSSAKFVDDYVKLRPLLEFSWPSETRRATHHVALRKKDVANVFTSNNVMQFTKYSRLQWHLYEKKV